MHVHLTRQVVEGYRSISDSITAEGATYNQYSNLLGIVYC